MVMDLQYKLDGPVSQKSNCLIPQTDKNTTSRKNGIRLNWGARHVYEAPPAKDNCIYLAASLQKIKSIRTGGYGKFDKSDE